MKIIESKLNYLILLLTGLIILLLVINYVGFKNSSVSFYGVGSYQNLGCLSVYIDEMDNASEYSFDNGKTWQKSNYGVVYQNGKNILLARDKDNNIIYQNTITVNNIVSNAPSIKYNANLNSGDIMEGVTATLNGENIISKVKTKILGVTEDKLLVSYFAENNENKCYLLREINVDIKLTIDNNWLWPTDVPHRISSDYGWRWGKMHYGVDITGPGRGSKIYAARAGEIYKIDSNSSSGFYVIIKHDNGYYTRYAHLQNTDGNDNLKGTSSAYKYTEVGQRVKAHQAIGEMGSSGNSTGTHLHFEIWNGIPYSSQSYDPLMFYK